MNLSQYNAYLPFYLILSTVLGSFMNMLVWRLPRKESLEGRSHCFSCGHVLRAIDLIPIVSWLLLAGRCRYCGVKIPFRYLWLEVGMLISWSFCWCLSKNPQQLLLSSFVVSTVFFAVALGITWPKSS